MRIIEATRFADATARELPSHLSGRCDALDLSGCRSLRALPWCMYPVDLNLRDCVSLRRLPEALPENMARLDLSGCVQITELPASLRRVAHLNIAGCPIVELPPHLEVTVTLELADSELASLPAATGESVLRWRSIPVSALVAFEPERITAADVFGEDNAERRRVLIERMGYDRFLEMTSADVVDEDTDRGGPRKLVSAWAGDDEAIVCLLVQCPSTGHRYALRVPPHIGSCHAAAAWIAGFDDPRDYAPVVET